MKTLLLANQSTGYLMTDIVNAVVQSRKFDKVELFAGEINIRPSVPDPSVKVIKTLKYDKRSTLRRLFTWLWAFLHLLFTVWCRGKDCELFLVSNPPLNVFIPLFTKKKYSFLVYDLYPDSLISQGFAKKDGWLARWWAKKTRQVFARAKNVFTISDDMKRMVAQYMDETKIKVIYNWAHNEHLQPISKGQNTFLAEHHLQEKFIVLYSGNMGMTHDIDVLVDVANQLKNRDDFCFLFIGEGAKKPLIEQKVHEYGLGNCLVLPFQPTEVLPFSMGAADVAVVTTDRGQTGLSVPSKTYSYLAVGAPLLCLADPNSELGQLVLTNQVGRCFGRDEVAEMASFLTELADAPEELARLKSAARSLSLAYTPQNATDYVKFL